MTTPTTPRTPRMEVREQLGAAVEARESQLAALPVPHVDDLVAVLHRESVERILAELRAAHRRLDDGTYGTCVKCTRPIAPDRLELRPWAATCTGCAPR